MTRSSSRQAFHGLVFSTALFVASLVTAPQAHAQQVLDGLAAVVNGDPITFSQVREIVGEREQALRDSYHGPDLMDKIKQIRLAALNDLIDRQLIIQEFKKKGYNLPDFAVDGRIQDIIRQDFGGDRLAFMRTLNAQGMTLDEFRQKELEKIIVQAMRQQSVNHDLMVPPKEINEYYSQHIADFSTPAQVKLRMIVLKGDSGSPESIKQMAAEIRKKVQDGGQFDQLAQMYSQDSSQESGGDWGWVDSKTLNEDLSKVAFALKPGQVSNVVQTGGNYYLLYVEAKRPEVVKSLAEVRDQVVRQLQDQQQQKFQQQWIASLRSKAFIKMF
ncbi:MAG: peptidyl-prolyl cis-trans isomerase [Chthoniobacteraceae bacterium]